MRTSENSTAIDRAPGARSKLKPPSAVIQHHALKVHDGLRVNDRMTRSLRPGNLGGVRPRS
eukprot:5774553-Prymnesium_polylepis.1